MFFTVHLKDAIIELEAADPKTESYSNMQALIARVNKLTVEFNASQDKEADRINVRPFYFREKEMIMCCVDYMVPGKLHVDARAEALGL